MNLFALSGLLIGITSSSLGLFVYLKDRKNPLNRIWGIFALAVAAWGFGAYEIATTLEPETALMWWRLTHVAVILIPVFFFHFVYEFLGLKQKLAILIIYAIGLAFLFLNLTDLFIRSTRFVFNSFYYDSPPGPVYPYFVAFFFGAIIYSHYELLRAYRHSSGARRNQIKYFFLATAVGFLGGGTSFLPVFGVDLYPILNFTVPLYPIIMSYAIVQYRLMDISVVINKGVAYALLLGTIVLPIYLTIAVSQRATFYSIPPLLAGTLILACGLWVLLNNPRGVTNITFSLVGLGACIWLFSQFMSYSASRDGDALFWGKSSYVGVVFIPAFVYHFSTSLLSGIRQYSKRWTATNYLISTAFLFLIPTPYLINGQHAYFWGHYPQASALHPLFLLYFCAVGGFSLYQLYQGYKSKDGLHTRESIQLKYVFWAFAIGFAASIDFVQSYGIELYPSGFVFASLWVMIVTYAIAKHQLLDIELLPAEKWGLPFAQILAVVVLYFFVLFLIRLFTGSMQYLLAGILLATTLAVAGLFVSLPREVEKATAKFLFRKRYDAYETLTAFSRAMVTILDLSALNNTIMTTLSNVMGIKIISLFLLDKEKNEYVLAAAHGTSSDELQGQRFSADHALPYSLGRAQAIVVREELQHPTYSKADQPILETLERLESEVCVPLVNKDRFIGFINLGPRDDHRMYSEEDLKLLTNLAQNAAVALDNAMLYEDLRRSKILMRRTDRLRSLETIAGGFAHEIRNPLTSIKTFIQLAPERKQDEEFIDQFSTVAIEDVRRIERLIQEILDYARYMEPKFMEDDINEIVASCLYFVEVKANSKSIEIHKELTPDLPQVRLDRQQIKQVLLNLFLNAMDAMGERGGLLTIRTRRLIKPTGDVWVQIEVADSGSGIAGADLEHIFDPFFTTKHESGEREGTGLGLTIVHQIIQEHNGSIEVDSKLGSGTIFLVTLPVSPQPRELTREWEEHETTDSIGR